MARDYISGLFGHQQLAQAALRSDVGKMDLDGTFEQRTTSASRWPAT